MWKLMTNIDIDKFILDRYSRRPRTTGEILYELEEEENKNSINWNGFQ